MAKPVKTKADFVRRYNRGEFGNASPTWPTVQDWAADPNGHGTKGWNGPRLFHLRNRVKGGPTWYNLTVNDLLWHIGHKLEPGTVADYYVSEMAPTALTTLQGEVRDDPGGLTLTYSTVAKPMRDALRERTQHVSGLYSKALLRQAMNPVSYDWLCVLLQRYSGHVVEFSCYRYNWGTLPGYDTVFWEVRNY